MEQGANCTLIVYCPIAGSYIDWKFSCFHIGSVFYYNRICHEHICGSEKRLCPSCIVQGDISRKELKHEVFSLGDVDGKDCPWCAFHNMYGAQAKRTDKELTPAGGEVDQAPGEQNIIMCHGVRYRVVEKPKMAEFIHSIHVAVRKMRVRQYSLACAEERKQNKDEHIRRCVIALLADEADRREAKVVARQEEMLQKRKRNTFFYREADFEAYRRLEDCSHGIRTEDIIMPAWFPHQAVSPETMSKAVASLLRGHRISVNVSQAGAELLDNPGYLLAISKMRINNPPLDITRINSPDAVKIRCYQLLGMSEWETYLLIKTMLGRPGRKSIARLLGWNEVRLAVFMEYGHKIERRKFDADFLKKLSKGRKRLRDVIV